MLNSEKKENSTSLGNSASYDNKIILSLIYRINTAMTYMESSRNEIGTESTGNADGCIQMKSLLAKTFC